MLAASNSSATNRLLHTNDFAHDSRAIDEVLARHRERLRKVVRLRLDWRLRGRISSNSLLDQVFAEARQSIGSYSENEQSLFVWLRELTCRHIDRVQRENLGDRAGEVASELHLHTGSRPAVTAASMAAQLLGDRSANQDAVRADMLMRLQGALNVMDVLDREILALRNFEELTIDEAAAVLGMTRSAATLRYLHAVKRLNEILSSIPGFLPKGRA